MRLRVAHNMADIGHFATFVFAEQLPFVTAMAINDSAKVGQKAQREHQERAFDINRSDFFRRAVKIRPFATKQRPWAKISVDPPGGAKRRSVIARHEADAVRLPFDGGSLAIPTDHVPRNAVGVIARQWRPRSLLGGGLPHGASGRVVRGKVSHFRVKRGGRTHTGRRAAFLIRKSGGRGTIFERDGADLVALYQLVPFVGLDFRLNFVDNITRAVLDTYPAAFVTRFDRAIRTAR